MSEPLSTYLYWQKYFAQLDDEQLKGLREAAISYGSTELFKRAIQEEIQARSMRDMVIKYARKRVTPAPQAKLCMTLHLTELCKQTS